MKAREILRLKYEKGLSLRDIGKSCDCGKTTVSEVLSRAKKAGISWPIEYADKKLMSLLYPPLKGQRANCEPDMGYIYQEMKKKHVTLMLLWEEYKAENPNGIMYTQFCERYRAFKAQNKLYLHKEHKAGEEVEVDWAGTKIPYVDTSTGEVKEASVFVAVLPASNYPFVYAYENEKIGSWIDAHVRTYQYFCGVPRVTIPDNAKTAVITPDLFDPSLNRIYAEMAKHYGTTIIPARAYKPKDKGADEGMVGIVSRRIFAAIRNVQFFSIAEINHALKEELDKLIKKPFQRMEINRIEAFEQIDKPNLQPLPLHKYEYADWLETKVAFNYHVEYSGFFYSVDFKHVGKECSVRATNKTIEIFIGNERIAVRKRNYNKFSRYDTLPEHMPEHHKAVYGWNDARFLSWAEKTGVHTRAFVESILASRQYSVQTYRACMGIMRLSENYPSEIMEMACKEAIEKNAISFKYFNVSVKKVAADTDQEETAEKVIQHENIRGVAAFGGGGIHVK